MTAFRISEASKVRILRVMAADVDIDLLARAEHHRAQCCGERTTDTWAVCAVETLVSGLDELAARHNPYGADDAASLAEWREMQAELHDHLRYLLTYRLMRLVEVAS